MREVGLIAPLSDPARCRAALPDGRRDRVRSSERLGTGERPVAKRILVVDDDTSVAEGIRLLLAHDHLVETAHSGAEGLAMLLERNAEFDAILCDVMMPGISGVELYRRLGHFAPAASSRFIFMTGGAFTASARRFLDGVDNLQLHKPFDMAAMYRVLRQAFSRQAG